MLKSNTLATEYSLSFIARDKKQIVSVIVIASKPGTRDPIVTNDKTQDQVPAELLILGGLRKPRF